MSNVPWGSEAERADYWYKAWETENTEVKRLHAELEQEGEATNEHET
jgi:AMMECR1 domain-containing protein